MEILELIVKKGIILIPFLNIIGEVIKRVELISNRYIPLILLLISVAFCPFVLGGYTADNIVQSVLVAGASVFGFEIYKDMIKK